MGRATAACAPISFKNIEFNKYPAAISIAAGSRAGCSKVLLSHSLFAENYLPLFSMMLRKMLQLV
jgi:hypothetical protein